MDTDVVGRELHVGWGESPTARWEMTNGAPGSGLAGMVVAYCGYSEKSVRPAARREFAAASVVLVVGFGGPLLVVDALSGTGRAHTEVRSADHSLHPRQGFADAARSRSLASIALSCGYYDQHTSTATSKRSGSARPPSTSPPNSPTCLAQAQ